MTCLGLLSDSHGEGPITRRAVDQLLAHGATRLIHLGDVGSTDVIDALAVATDANGNLQPPAHIVFGNTDYNATELGRYAQALGIQMDHPEGRLTLEGKTIVFQHGHRDHAMRAALTQGVDYLLHGHTHRCRDERIGPTRVINPGALTRATPYTVACLDLKTGRLKTLEII